MMEYSGQFKLFPENYKGDIPEEIEGYGAVSIHLGASSRQKMPRVVRSKIVSFRGIKEHMLLPEVFEAEAVYIDTPALLMDPRILDYEVCYRKTPNAIRRWKGSPIDPEEIKFFQDKGMEEMIPYLRDPKWWIQDLARWRLDCGI